MTTNHRPRKRFGQHFLRDRAVLGRVVEAFGVGGRVVDRVVEVGPGLGGLTDLLVAGGGGGGLVAVELDRDLARRLRRRYSAQRVRVVQADILEFDVGAEAVAAGGQLRLIGNLPYNISTPLIFRLLRQLEHIDEMLFMLQKEVALRLCAAPGGKRYGRLSVMTAVQLDCEALFDVPPQAFEPPPKVMSTLVRLTPKSRPLTPRDRRVFERLVAAAFSQRRKTLRNSLAEMARREHFERAEVDSSMRAEGLSAAQYVALADVLAAVPVEA